MIAIIADLSSPIIMIAIIADHAIIADPRRRNHAIIADHDRQAMIIAMIIACYDHRPAIML